MPQSTLTFSSSIGTLALSQPRSIATSLLAMSSPRISNFRYPMRRNTDTTLSHFRYFAPSLLRDLEYPRLGSSPCEPRVREISRSLPPVFHSLLWSHTLMSLSGYRTSRLRDSRCQIFDTFLTRSR
jgi:hypothetical protein